MVLLRITYRMRAHHMPHWERIFAEDILPLIQEHGLPFKSIWRTIVGDIGEYMELWEFDSVADFDTRWRTLIADPRLQKIFETTGPMVEDERFALMEPMLESALEPVIKQDGN